MIDTDTLKAGLDCREVMRAEMGDPAQHAGKAWQWWCPFHPDRNGKTPSLTAYRDGWKCFGCDAHGDVIGWVQKRRNLSFADACAALGAADLTAGQSLTVSRPPTVRLPEPPGDDWQDAAVAVVLRCMEVLWSDTGAEGLTWLRARGLNDATIRDAWLGYQPLAQWTGKDGVGYARAKGLTLARGVTIPHLVSNAPWAIKVATMLPEPESKYRMCKEDGAGTALYGADSLAGHDVAVICEGEFDALLLQQEAGDVAPVVTFGSASAHEVDAWLPWLLHLRRVLVATDNDAAGEKAWDYWHGKTKRARRLLPPGGVKDVTDAHLAGADLRAWVSGVVG